MHRSVSTHCCRTGLLVLITLSLAPSATRAADLAVRLLELSPETIAAQVQLRGDPLRGGILFHTSAAGCSKCHSDGSSPSPLGPKLTDISPEVSDAYLIESLLQPSRTIRKGYETVAVVTTDGRVKTGMLASENDTQVVLRELQDLLHPTVIPRDEIDEIEPTPTSMMPAGLVNSLQRERDVFDLLRYLFEVVRGGPERAAALRPAPEDLLVKDDSIGLDRSSVRCGPG